MYWQSNATAIIYIGNRYLHQFYWEIDWATSNCHEIINISEQIYWQIYWQSIANPIRWQSHISAIDIASDILENLLGNKQLPPDHIHQQTDILAIQCNGNNIYQETDICIQYIGKLIGQQAIAIQSVRHFSLGATLPSHIIQVNNSFSL